ncbi:tumor necrosis factor receptor superfamily member 22-like isoform X4 [Trematomus bernacchii]|uniref:tumor necrosis factor receptor superfamily member 22-like isoform X4 n=1 Tax=Trematomus bernacchii TaxID=40690 RepID=UPI00146D0B9C|nr:tumor necrosis factor receptor superfamily member 22-like isoform X4 [Trematomus bernacchii]
MTPSGLYLKIPLVFCFLRLTAAFPHSCKDDAYPHGNICCRNCPAGQRVVSHCSTAGGESVCEECQDGTFTEHDNGLKQCFKCAQCRSDQAVVRRCSHTQETECQCTAGMFCSPDEACEVCRRCSSCAPDEETVRNCTSTTNTECKKNAPKSDPDSEKAAWIVPLVVMAAALIIAGIIIAMWRRRRAKESQSSAPDGLKAGQEEESFPKLVPNNGDDSLRKCFQFFDELDFAFHSRFFRHLDVSDNDIKSKEHLHEDKIYVLLNIWLEMKGRDASLNDLLRALLDLNQRRTAENIKDKALQYGHYTCQSLEGNN